jgi:hypothetical protein
MVNREEVARGILVHYGSYRKHEKVIKHRIYHGTFDSITLLHFGNNATKQKIMEHMWHIMEHSK